MEKVIKKGCWKGAEQPDFNTVYCYHRRKGAKWPDFNTVYYYHRKLIEGSKAAWLQHYIMLSTDCWGKKAKRPDFNTIYCYYRRKRAKRPDFNTIYYQYRKLMEGSRATWLQHNLNSFRISRGVWWAGGPEWIPHLTSYLLIYKYVRPVWEWYADYNFDIIPSLLRRSPIGLSHHSFYIIPSLPQGLVMICVSTMGDQCGSDVLTKHWCCLPSTMENSMGVILLSHFILILM